MFLCSQRSNLGRLASFVFKSNDLSLPGDEQLLASCVLKTNGIGCVQTGNSEEQMLSSALEKMTTPEARVRAESCVAVRRSIDEGITKPETRLMLEKCSFDLELMIKKLQNASELGDDEEEKEAKELLEVVVKKKENFEYCFNLVLTKLSSEETLIRPILRSCFLDQFALNCLGWVYWKGENIPIDNMKAMMIYERASSMGNVTSMNSLAVMYENDKRIAHRDQKAFNLYQKSASLGNALAMFNCAKMLIDGVLEKSSKSLIDRKYSLAVEYLKKGSSLGSDLSMNLLGWCYTEGKGVPRDFEKAAELFSAAVKLGNGEAAVGLAGCSTKKNDYQKTLELLKQAASQGITDAMVNLGLAFEFGDGVEIDINKAIEYYNQASEKGNNRAKIQLARLQMKHDPQEAVKLYKSGADHGDSDGMLNYALCAQKGIGMEKNEEEAVEYLKKAALTNHEYAIYQLGLCYLYGKGVKKDINLAREYLETALKLGVDQAEKYLEELKKRIKNN